MTDSTIRCTCPRCGHEWTVTRSQMNASAGRWQACPVCAPSTCTECGAPLKSTFEYAVKICTRCVEGGNP